MANFVCKSFERASYSPLLFLNFANSSEQTFSRSNKSLYFFAGTHAESRSKTIKKGSSENKFLIIIIFYKILEEKGIKYD